MTMDELKSFKDSQDLIGVFLEIRSSLSHEDRMHGGAIVDQSNKWQRGRIRANQFDRLAAIVQRGATPLRKIYHTGGRVTS